MAAQECGQAAVSWEYNLVCEYPRGADTFSRGAVPGPGIGAGVVYFPQPACSKAQPNLRFPTRNGGEAGGKAGGPHGRVRVKTNL